VGNKQDFEEVEMSAIRILIDDLSDKQGDIYPRWIYALQEIADRLDAIDKVNAKQSELNAELVATMEQLTQQAHVHAVSQSPVERPKPSAEPESNCTNCRKGYVCAGEVRNCDKWEPIPEHPDPCDTCNDAEDCCDAGPHECGKQPPIAGDDDSKDLILLCEKHIKNYQEYMDVSQGAFEIRSLLVRCLVVIKQRDELRAQVAELTVEKEQMHKMYEDAVAKRGEQ